MGFSASGDVEANERECYLDLLPDNVLENIMRLMSASPRSSTWSEQLAETDICTLFSQRGEMERVARKCFRLLRIDEYSDPACESGKFCAYQLAISNKTIYDAKLLNSGSPSYTALEIRDPVSNLFVQPVDLNEFLVKCPNVKDLDVCSDRTRTWIEKLGPRLERLEIHAPSPSICIPISSYCRQLRELHIKQASKSNVFHLDLWEEIGGTLEKLAVHFMFSASMEIRKIQQHCRKIQWIHIVEEERVSPALPECIGNFWRFFEESLL